MQLAQPCESPPPVILGAVGPKTLALAGAHCDGVVLHPFLTTEGVARSVRIVRDAARDAGRDPEAVAIYATVVTAPDSLLPKQREDILEARAVSRSEEHTSELQSLMRISYAVFCLKKKTLSIDKP